MARPSAGASAKTLIEDMRVERLRGLWLGLLLLFGAQAVNAASVYGCGELTNAYGPFDYTNPVHFRDKLPIVETHHFTGNVENLLSGQSGTVAGDLDYTLRAFPNHHRALYALIRYDGQGKSMGDYYSVDCYFDRAIRFKPDDGYVYMLQGIHRHRKGKLKEAMESYREAKRYIGDSAELDYNLGLLEFDRKNYSAAREHADSAYAKGYPLPGLKRKLQSVGKW